LAIVIPTIFGLFKKLLLQIFIHKRLLLDETLFDSKISQIIFLWLLRLVNIKVIDDWSVKIKLWVQVNFFVSFFLFWLRFHVVRLAFHRVKYPIFAMNRFAILHELAELFHMCLALNQKREAERWIQLWVVNFLGWWLVVAHVCCLNRLEIRPNRLLGIMRIQENQVIILQTYQVVSFPWTTA